MMGCEDTEDNHKPVVDKRKQMELIKKTTAETIMRQQRNHTHNAVYCYIGEDK